MEAAAEQGGETGPDLSPLPLHAPRPMQRRQWLSEMREAGSELPHAVFDKSWPEGPRTAMHPDPILGSGPSGSVPILAKKVGN